MQTTVPELPLSIKPDYKKDVIRIYLKELTIKKKEGSIAMAQIFNEKSLPYELRQSPIPEFSWHTSPKLAEIVKSKHIQFDIRSLDQENTLILITFIEMPRSFL